MKTTKAVIEVLKTNLDISALNHVTLAMITQTMKHW
jgi:hypothetical protein